MDAEEVDSPIPPPSQRRIRLATVDEIRVEMAQVYRDVRQGKLASEVGTKLTYMLVQLARVTEVATVEARLRRIEEAMQNGGPLGIEHQK